MFQFSGFPSLRLCIHLRIPTHYHRWVSSFGYLRVDGYLLLTVAFRSLSRPSSAPSAKASALCSFSLDLTSCLSFLRIAALLLPLRCSSTFVHSAPHRSRALHYPKNPAQFCILFFVYCCVATRICGAQILLYIPLLYARAPCTTQKILRNFAFSFLCINTSKRLSRNRLL